MYTLLLSGFIERADGLLISPDAANVDYQEYLKWASEGNQPVIESAAVIAAPDFDGFLSDLNVTLGSIVEQNLFYRAYPLVHDALLAGHWSDLATLLTDAVTQQVLTQQKLNAIKLSAINKSIPISGYFA